MYNVIKVILKVLLKKGKASSGILSVCAFVLSFSFVVFCVTKFSLKPSFDKTWSMLKTDNMNVNIDINETSYAELKTFMNTLKNILHYDIRHIYLASRASVGKYNMDFAFVGYANDYIVNSGEVVLNGAINAEIGEKLKLTFDDKEAEFNIHSIVLDPINQSHDNNIPYCWLSENDLKKLIKDINKGSYYITVKVSGINGDEVKDWFINSYEKYFNKVFTGVITDYNDIANNFIFRYTSFSIIFAIIMIFFGIVSTLICIFAIRMQIQDDRIFIGKILSIGSNRKHLERIYLFGILLKPVIAGFIGAAFAAFGCTIYFKEIFSLISVAKFSIYGIWIELIIAAFLTPMMILVITKYYFKKISKITVYKLLNANSDLKQTNRYYDLFKFKNQSLNYAILKIKNNQSRSWLIFTITLITVFILITVFNIFDSARVSSDHISDWGLVDMDVYIYRKSGLDEKTAGIIKEMESDESVDYYYAAISDRVVCKTNKNNMSYVVLADVYDKSFPNKMEYKISYGRNPKNYDEVAVGLGFARKHNIKLGDKINILHNNIEYNMKTVGIYPSYKEYGNIIRFLVSDIKDYFNDNVNGYYSVVLKKGENIVDFTERMKNKYKDFDFFPMIRSSSYILRELIIPVIIITVLVSLLYLLLILLNAVIIVKQSRKDYKVLKAVGFSDKNLKQCLGYQLFLPGITGIIVAIVSFKLFASKLLSVIAVTIGMDTVPIYYNLWIFVAISIIILLVIKSVVLLCTK